MRALGEAGIIDLGTTYRVIIDLKADEVAIIHVQLWGDTRLLDVVRTLDGVEIRRETTDG